MNRNICSSWQNWASCIISFDSCLSVVGTWCFWRSQRWQSQHTAIESSCSFGVDLASPVPRSLVGNMNSLFLEEAESKTKRVEASNYPYTPVVESLLYLSTLPRPDIVITIGILSRFVQSPGTVHWMAAERIFRDLWGATSNRNVIGDVGSVQRTQSINFVSLSPHCHSDWARNIKNRNLLGDKWFFWVKD